LYDLMWWKKASWSNLPSTYEELRRIRFYADEGY
jgi:hypothetical protein